MYVSVHNAFTLYGSPGLGTVLHSAMIMSGRLSAKVLQSRDSLRALHDFHLAGRSGETRSNTNLRQLLLLVFHRVVFRMVPYRSRHL